MDIRRTLRFPTFGNAGPVDWSETYDQIVAVTEARLRMLDDALREQVERAAQTGEPEDGLVGQTAYVTPDGRTIAGGEQVRALERLVHSERVLLSKLIRDRATITAGVARLAAQMREDRRIRQEVAAETMAAFLDEVGLDRRSPEVQRAAVRAVTSGLANAGFADDVAGAPDEAPLDSVGQARARLPRPGERA
ncbi:hypothetical protein [Pseudonocardia alni]|uniref:hypothetical protein n=1 Tax=Pseudonocardia alni TaxID=33907 RepID=UPI0033317909